MKSLERLNIQQVGMPDKVLIALCNVRSLKNLNVSLNGELTDNGVKAMKNLKNLEKVYLTDCKRVTNASLVAFTQLTSLKELHCGGTAVNLRGAEELNKARKTLDPVAVMGPQ